MLAIVLSIIFLLITLLCYALCVAAGRGEKEEHDEDT